MISYVILYESLIYEVIGVAFPLILSRTDITVLHTFYKHSVFAMLCDKHIDISVYVNPIKFETAEYC